MSIAHSSYRKGGNAQNALSKWIGQSRNGEDDTKAAVGLEAHRALSNVIAHSLRRKWRELDHLHPYSTARNGDFAESEEKMNDSEGPANRMSSCGTSSCEPLNFQAVPHHQ